MQILVEAGRRTVRIRVGASFLFAVLPPYCSSSRRSSSGLIRLLQNDRRRGDGRKKGLTSLTEMLEETDRK